MRGTWARRGRRYHERAGRGRSAGWRLSASRPDRTAPRALTSGIVASRLPSAVDLRLGQAGGYGVPVSAYARFPKSAL